MRGGLRKLAVLAWALLLPALPAHAGDRAPVQVERDVPYGKGIVGADQPDGGHYRTLTMDVYQPAGTRPGDHRPAVILAFGGAFLRGSKDAPPFVENGASNTPMGDYCRFFARAGYTCFSIDYRLSPEVPGLDAPFDPALVHPQSAIASPQATARVELVRQRMGLPPLDDATRKQLYISIFAAAEDMDRAAHFVAGNASRFGIDPDRLALGGFSAGAITAVNAAYGRHAPVQAVFALSGGTSGYDLTKTVTGKGPPGLFLLGQEDLPGIGIATRYAVSQLKAKGVETHFAWVPGFGHFYPIGAVTLGEAQDKAPVGERVLAFLNATIGQPEESQ